MTADGKRSDKIAKLVSIAASEERRSGALTGRYRRVLEEQESRLGELNAYRRNYAEMSQSVQDIDAARWKDYQGFISRLDEALKAQKQLVTDSAMNLEKHRRVWLDKRRRLKSLQRVLETCRDDEIRDADKKEQRLLDDLPAGPNPFRGNDGG
ncbi:MAG: flagellar export protein FliJ [Woeseiaceae bacterium]|nr:flagellar export protein FliJ [Woeseiaceae bacterium]